MQVIVVGAGRVGQRLCETLIESGESVALVDRSPELLESAKHIDCPKFRGVPLDEDVLRQAGIDSADLVCSVTRDDNMNLIVAQIAKYRFEVPRTIARLDNLTKARAFKELGIETFCTSEWTVKKIWQLIHGSETVLRHPFYGQELLYKLIPAEEELVGLKLEDVRELGAERLIGILRGEVLHLYDPDFEIAEGDRFVLLSVE